MREASSRPLRRDEVPELIGGWCWTPRRPRAGQVGVEAEVLPVRVGVDGAPAGRLSLADVVTVLRQHAAADVSLQPRAEDPNAVPAVVVEGGGCLTLEPGGQLEVVTGVHTGSADVLAALDTLMDGVSRAFAARGVSLACAGLDVWHDPPAQQLRAPRYPAMAAYFALRGGPAGATMMRHTCALQVNVELGPPEAAAERWLVANLVAPLLVATFATSPSLKGVSGRSLAWQALDATRTGFPAGLLRGDPDPVAVLTDAALTADVLLVRAGDGRLLPGVPGWTFGEWLRDGHPQLGRPTSADLATHLTTLFPEVRVRGFLEFRSIDMLPRRWWPVPLVLLAGLLDDEQARGRVLGVLDPYRAHLPRLLAIAASSGVAHPALCALAVETWSLALAGAARLPAGAVPPGALRSAEAFLDRFTLRGRCPADELRARTAISPAAGLAWATGPIGSAVVC